MQNEYYQSNPTRNKLIMVAIAISSLAIIALIILVTILIIKNINGGSLESLDPNYITIEFDGTKFKVADTYGEIIREIAKQRKIYDWGGLMDHRYTEVTNIESYLDQYILGNEEYSDGNDKNTIIKKQDSFYPDIFIEVDKTIRGLDMKATKIDKANVRIVVYPIGEDAIELKIDGHTLKAKETTSAEFEKMFKEAKEYISNNGSTQNYKIYDFTYKKRRFGAAFSENDKLEHLEIQTYTKD